MNVDMVSLICFVLFEQAFYISVLFYCCRDNIGFPIVMCGSDGQFVLTKPPGTGGLVSRATVCEQLLYEVANPALYFLPDVVCDFTNVEIEELPNDAVFVTGARGSPPSGEYKVSRFIS